MTVLTGYLMRTILLGTLLVLVVLLALAALFEFIGQIDDVQGNYTIATALLYAALRLPQLSFEMLPVAALIGSLLGLGALANSSELVVMRTSGYSVRKLAAMVSVAGFVLLAATALIGEFIGPPLDYFARNMRNEARFQQEGAYASAAWVRDGPVILHLERVSSEFEFGGVYLFRLGENHSLRSVARAENSGIDDTDQWVLENFRETRFHENGVEAVEASVAVESFDLSSDLLGVTLVKPVSLSARGLLTYIRYLKRNSLTAERYEIELWSRVARTATVLIMPVLGLAFVFGSLRSAGHGARLILGVLIGLAYFLASEMLASSGQVFNLNPAIVAWIPSGALLLVTLFALTRVR